MIWIQDFSQMYCIVNFVTWSNPASCVASFWICDEFVSRSRSFPGVPNDLSGNAVLDIYSTVPLKQAMVSSPLSVVTCHGINKSWGGRVHLPDPRKEKSFLLIQVVFAPFSPLLPVIFSGPLWQPHSWRRTGSSRPQKRPKKRTPTWPVCQGPRLLGSSSRSTSHDLEMKCWAGF